MCARAVAVSALEALPGFKPLDGCHCISSSLARIFQHAKHPLSEEMILGLGAGVGFVYWRMKFGDQDSVFVGGRANLKNFYQDLGRRTGVVIREKQTASSAKAETELLKALEQKRPVMLGGDMGMLPWFEFPGDYHFGGHTFVACGYDGGETVLCSDIDQKASGVKKGFLAKPWVGPHTDLKREKGARRNRRLAPDVIGPDGSPLTIADLPPKNTRRWVIRRKAEVVAAVRGGLLSLEEACARYTLSVDEFLNWQAAIDKHGLAGLRTTWIQHYREG